MCYLWCTKRKYGRFSPNTSVPPAIQFHRLLSTHHHPSFRAGTISQIVADVPSGLSLIPPQKTKGTVTWCLGLFYHVVRQSYCRKEFLKQIFYISAPYRVAVMWHQYEPRQLIRMLIEVSSVASELKRAEGQMYTRTFPKCIHCVRLVKYAKLAQTGSRNMEGCDLVAVPLTVPCVKSDLGLGSFHFWTNKPNSSAPLNNIWANNTSRSSRMPFTVNLK
jgi:hypothetical protein